MSNSKNKELHQNQTLLFLYHARKDGWNIYEVLEILKGHARQKKWLVTLPAIDLDAEKLLCPNCETLNDKEQHFCTTCKQALYTECPRCSQQVPCEYSACGNCGFEVGNRYLVDNLIEALNSSLKAGDVERAGQIASEAETAWNQIPDQQDYRSQQIAACKAHIRRLLAVQKQAQKDALEGLRQLAIYEVEIDQQRSISIEWKTPHAGTVDIIKSSQLLPQSGHIIPETELDQLGQRLEKISLRNVAIDQWKPEEIVYYTPVVLLQQKAYVGLSQRYVCVENVRQLQHHYLDSKIRLYWVWPSQCQEVAISYHTVHWPQHEASDSTTCFLSRTEYDRLGHYEINDILSCDYYIVVSAIAQIDDEKIHSQGTRLFVRTASKTVITYDIKPPTLLRKRHLLHLKITPLDALPALLIVGKQGKLPLHKTDGELFYSIEATMPREQEIFCELPETSLLPKTFGKLFFVDDIEYQKFIIHHPSLDQMRLS